MKLPNPFIRKPPQPPPSRDVGVLVLTVVLDDEGRYPLTIKGGYVFGFGREIVTSARESAFERVRTWHRNGFACLGGGVIVPVRRVKCYEIGEQTECVVEATVLG